MPVIKELGQLDLVLVVCNRKLGRMATGPGEGTPILGHGREGPR